MTEGFPGSGSVVLPALTVLSGLFGGLLGWLLGSNFFPGTSAWWLLPVLPLATVLAGGAALLVTHRGVVAGRSTSSLRQYPPPGTGHPGWDTGRAPQRAIAPVDPLARADPRPSPAQADRASAQHPPHTPTPDTRTGQSPSLAPPAKVVHRLGGADTGRSDPGAGRTWWNETSPSRPAVAADAPLPARPLSAYDPENALVVQCPRCGGLRLDVEGDDDDTAFAFRCRRCHYEWRWQVGAPTPPVVVRAVPPRDEPLPAALPTGDPHNDFDTDRRA